MCNITSWLTSHWSDRVAFGFQMCITSSQMQWTADVTKALTLTKERGDKRALKSLKKKQVPVKFHQCSYWEQSLCLKQKFPGTEIFPYVRNFLFTLSRKTNVIPMPITFADWYQIKKIGGWNVPETFLHKLLYYFPTHPSVILINVMKHKNIEILYNFSSNWLKHIIMLSANH